MNIVAPLGHAWTKFWFSSSSTQSLGILRIFYGICLIAKATGFWGLEKGRLPRIRLPLHRVAPISELGDLYRDPVPGFEWIPAIGPDMWATFEMIGLIAALFWTVGFLTRMSGIVVFLSFALPMLHSRFDYWHHSANFLFFMMLFACLDMGQHYSLDRLLFPSEAKEPPRTVASIRTVQVLLTWVYISTLFGKLNQGWFDGTVMRILADSGMLKGPFLPYILSTIGTFGLSWYTLFAQAFFAIFVWTRYRRWAFAVGATLHIGIDLVMNVTTFSFQMMSLYICFIHPESGLTRVYYDSRSRSQVVKVEALRPLNWFDRITWVDVRSPSAGTSKADVPELAGGLVVQRADGVYLAGLHAWREVTGLLPLTFLPSFVLEFITWIVPARHVRLAGDAAIVAPQEPQSVR